MPTFDSHRNLAISTVASAPMPPATGTSLVVAAGEGSRFDPPPFNCTVCDPSGPPTPLTAEIVRVTSLVGDTLTYLRTQEGTSARAIAVGDLIYLAITAKTLTDIEQAITTGAPVLHHLTHEAGGSDEVTLAQSQVTGLTGALGGKVDSTDPRLTDARPPLAHAVTHMTAGSDAVNLTGLAGFPGGTTNFLRGDRAFAVPTGVVPSTHAPTHASGGADPVTVTTLAGYPGGTANFLRADGAFAAPPTGGIPSAHHATHETGGSDAVVALAGSVITSGTVVDARLSANVALKNMENVFTVGQTLVAVNPSVKLQDTVPPVDARVFRLVNQNQLLYVIATDDLVTVNQAYPLQLDRLGNAKVGANLSEKGRPTPLGHWIEVPFNAANFTTESGSVTISSATTQRYMLVGNTLVYAFYLYLTITGTPLWVGMALPAGVTGGAKYMGTPFNFSGPTVGAGMARVDPGAAILRLMRDPANVLTWAAGAYYFIGTVSCEMA